MRSLGTTVSPRPLRRSTGRARAAEEQQRPKSSLGNRMRIRRQGPQRLMNRALASSSPIVVSAEQVCHAGGRGFESCRSRLESRYCERLLPSSMEFSDGRSGPARPRAAHPRRPRLCSGRPHRLPPQRQGLGSRRAGRASASLPRVATSSTPTRSPATPGRAPGSSSALRLSRSGVSPPPRRALAARRRSR